MLSCLPGLCITTTTSSTLASSYTSPKTTLFLFLQLLLIPPPPSPWTCLLPLCAAWADQSVQFFFSYNRTQAARLPYTQRPCLFSTGLQKKKAEGGYCWCTESLCITSAKTWTQTKECRHQKNTHTFSATSNPATIKGWGPGKLGQRGYFYGCALFGGCRVPRLPCRDALFLMMNSFKRVFPSFFFFVSFCTYEWGTFLWEKWKWFFSMGFQRSMR